MFRLRAGLIVILACFCLQAPLLFAGDDWVPVDPADLKATSEPNAPGADAVILYREETHNDMLYSESYYVRIKILTEKGKQRWSHIEIPTYKKREWWIDYNNYYTRPSITTVGSIKARTIHSDGTIIPLTSQIDEKVIAKGTADETITPSFDFPSVEVGSIVEYRYAKRWENIQHAPSWIVQQDLYQRKVVFDYTPWDFGKWNGMSLGGEAFMNSHLEILTNVSWVAFIPKQLPQPAKFGPRIVLTAEHLLPVEVEEFMPPAEQMKYRVRFFFTYGTTTADQAADYWDHEAKYWKKDVEKFIGNSGRMTSESNKIIAPTDSPEQRAQKLYAEVQKLDNLTYLRTISENEGESKLPKSVEDVLGQKRGYDSDLTRLYVALARAAGLEAFVMKVSSRDKWIFERLVLDTDQLDSEIAIVKIGDKEVFLDPGSKFCPYGMLDWKHTGVQGMRETPSGKVEFVQAPGPNLKLDKTERLADMQLSKQGDLTGKITLQFHGDAALELRQSALLKDENQRNKDLEESLRGLLPPGATVALDQSAYWQDASKPLVARFNVSIPKYATVADTKLNAPASLFQHEADNALTRKGRTNPVYFKYPYYDVEVLNLQLPEELHVATPAKGAKQIVDFGAYVLAANGDKQKLTLHRELMMNGFVFSPADYSKLQSFYEQVKTTDEQTITFDTVGQTADAGAK